MSQTDVSPGAQVKKGFPRQQSDRLRPCLSKQIYSHAKRRFCLPLHDSAINYLLPSSCSYECLAQPPPNCACNAIIPGASACLSCTETLPGRALCVEIDDDNGDDRFDDDDFDDRRRTLLQDLDDVCVPRSHAHVQTTMENITHSSQITL